MEQNQNPAEAPQPSRTDPDWPPQAPAAPPARIGWREACPEPGRSGHLPGAIEPLDPQHPDAAVSETRAPRHDGWTPERKMRFLQRLAECGTVAEACRAVGMSARAAYNLRDREPLFAAGWEAASLLARPRLADEAWSRAMNGVVERIYKDGAVVAERHRYDNRLTMSVLARLDARADRAEERGAPHLALVARWEEYLAALAEDRVEDGLALLAAPDAGGDEESLQDRELRELHPAQLAAVERARGEDRHEISESEDGVWWTDYPPPPDFAGEEEGAYGDRGYRRTLTAREQAVIEADIAADAAAARARAEAQRAAYFGEAENLPSIRAT